MYRLELLIVHINTMLKLLASRYFVCDLFIYIYLLYICVYISISILGCCELKEVVSTQTYLYNPSIQRSRECLVINWMVNFCYSPYQL